MQISRRAVAALAGRRIDSEGAVPARFPLEFCSKVREEIANTLAREHVTLLVCSAACGADLLAVEAAIRLGIRNRIVLPFDTAEFRKRSVVDRPGGWGPLFDRAIEAASAAKDLLVLSADPEDDRAFSLANEAIIMEAAAAARPDPAFAIIVWEGNSREGSDATNEFRRMASDAGFVERTVLTV